MGYGCIHKSIRLFCCTWVGLFSCIAYGQLLEQPLSKIQNAQSKVHLIELAPMNIVASRTKAISGNSAPVQFAESVAYALDMHTVSTWQTVTHHGQPMAVMQLRITSPDALSLNLGFSRYYMPRGGRLFVYSDKYAGMIGPFTDKDNEQHGQLWTPLIDGNNITIEINVPLALKGQLDVELSKINQGFIDIDRLSKQRPALKSGSCNVDVACQVAEDWTYQIRSVARYTRNGIFLCSGAAINNTANDKRGYFLTANHCGVNELNAATVVAYWNYQNSTCRSIGSVSSSQVGNGSFEQFNSGAMLRARHPSTDMALLEFDDPILPSANVFLAGWSRVLAEPIMGVGIHHPQGQEKRISFEFDPVTIQPSQINIGGNLYLSGNLLRIRDWDLGTTEGGSSGSPLFDQNKRIVGQLTGGFAQCGNNASDWYGRFAMSWEGDGSSSSSLKDWLDPIGSGGMVLNGTESLVIDRFEPDNDEENARFINSAIPQRHSLHEVGDKDWLTFQLEVFSDIELAVQAGPNDKIQVSLFDDNGQLIGKDAGSAAKLTLNNLAPGHYSVKVNDFNSDNYIGFYKIILNVFNRDAYESDGDAEQASEIKLDSPQQRSLYPEFDEDWVSFRLLGSESLNIKTAGTLGDTEIRLYDHSLTQIAYNNDANDSLFSQIKIDLPKGIYFIRVSELNDQPIASYDLTVETGDDFLLLFLPAIIRASKENKKTK